MAKQADSLEAIVAIGTIERNKGQIHNQGSLAKRVGNNDKDHHRWAG
jgi:hypothetical protein